MLYKQSMRGTHAVTAVLLAVAVVLYASYAPCDAGRLVAVVATVLLAVALVGVATQGLRGAIRGGGYGLRRHSFLPTHRTLRSQLAPISRKAIQKGLIETQPQTKEDIIEQEARVSRHQAEFENFEKRWSAPYRSSPDLKFEVIQRMKRLWALRGDPRFDDEAEKFRQYGLEFGNRACNRTALDQQGGICWIVAVVELVYNTPILRDVSDATRRWVRSTYELSMQREDRTAVCTRLPWHIERVYDLLLGSRDHIKVTGLSEDEFQTIGGRVECLLNAILLCDNLIVPQDTSDKRLSRVMGTFRLTENQDDEYIWRSIDKFSRYMDKTMMIKQWFVVCFKVTDGVIGLSSPWFEALRLACEFDEKYKIHGGLIDVKDDEGQRHSICFTVCYNNHYPYLILRTWGQVVDEEFIESELQHDHVKDVYLLVQMI